MGGGGETRVGEGRIWMGGEERRGGKEEGERASDAGDGGGEDRGRGRKARRSREGRRRGVKEKGRG